MNEILERYIGKCVKVDVFDGVYSFEKFILKEVNDNWCILENKYGEKIVVNLNLVIGIREVKSFNK